MPWCRRKVWQTRKGKDKIGEQGCRVGEMLHRKPYAGSNRNFLEQVTGHIQNSLN
tara:strand:- start:257 stop:421 length:165 start_codon:yes stop_codon:yes gene_type:complete